MSTNEEVSESIRSLLGQCCEHIDRSNKMNTALLTSLERDPLPADRLRRLRAFPGGWSDYGSDLLLWRWVTSFASTNPLVCAEVVSNVEGDDFE